MGSFEFMFYKSQYEGINVKEVQSVYGYLRNYALLNLASLTIFWVARGMVSFKMSLLGYNLIACFRGSMTDRNQALPSFIVGFLCRNWKECN